MSITSNRMLKAGLALAWLSLPAYSQIATTTTLIPSENPTLIGHTMTLTAIVAPAANGTVMFLDGFNILGTAVLNGSSTAVLALRFPAPRTYRVRAVYAGNATFARSISAPLNLLARPKSFGSFLAPITLPAAARFADVNRDGVPDIVTQDSAIRLGNGDGSFQSSMASAAGFPVVVTDFNNDGNPDVLNVSRSLALGNGDGSFQPPFDADPFAEPGLMTDLLRSDAVDLNRDGKTDLVLDGFVGLPGLEERKYVLGDASGHFGPTRPVIPYSAGFADFNGNDTADGGLSRSAFFDLNPSDTAPISTPNSAGYNAGTLTGDINGDGLDDVVSSFGVLREPVYTILAQLNSGAKTFHPTKIAHPASGWRALQLLDWNGDSFLDIVLVNNAGPANNIVAYLPGRGDGSFGGMKLIGSVPQPGFVLEDINGDSIVDLVVNLGTGSPVVVYPGSEQPGGLGGIQGPVSISPNFGSGLRGTWTVKYTAAARDGAPFPGISRQYVLLNTHIASQGGCFIEIAPSANQFRLWSDAANNWLGPIAGGSAQLLVSDSCILSGAGSRTGPPVISGAVADYESVIDLQFLVSFSGGKIQYLLSTGEDGSNSGWTDFGYWSVVPALPSPGGPYPQPSPSVILLSPLSGSGSSSTFTGVFSHTAGATGHYLGYMLFLPTPNVVNFVAKGSCLVEYNRISNGMRLIDDSGSGWLGGVSGIPIGASGSSLSNSVCTVDVSRARTTLSATTMTVTVPIVFASGLSRNIATFLQELDVNGQWTGMTQFGNWTNPAGPTTQPGTSIVGTKVVSDNATRTIEVTASSGTSRQPREVHVRIGAAITQAPVCHIVFSPQGNSIALISDSETALVDGRFFPIGTKHELHNGRCWFDAAKVRNSTTTTTTLTVPVTFPNLPGTKTIYVNVFDDAGHLTHWQQYGAIVDP